MANNMQLDMELVKLAQKRYYDLQDTKINGNGVKFDRLDTDFEPLDDEIKQNVKVNPKLKWDDKLYLLMKGRMDAAIKRDQRIDILIGSLIALLVFTGPIYNEVKDFIDVQKDKKEAAEERRALDAAAKTNLRSNAQTIDYRVQKLFLKEVLDVLQSSPNISNPGLYNKYIEFYNMVSSIDSLEYEMEEALMNGNVESAKELLDMIKYTASDCTMYAGNEFYEYIGSSEYPKYLDAIVVDGQVYFQLEDVEQEGVYYEDIRSIDGKVYVQEGSRQEVKLGN